MSKTYCYNLSLREYMYIIVIIICCSVMVRALYYIQIVVRACGHFIIIYYLLWYARHIVIIYRCGSAGLLLLLLSTILLFTLVCMTLLFNTHCWILVSCDIVVPSTSKRHKIKTLIWHLYTTFFWSDPLTYCDLQLTGGPFSRTCKSWSLYSTMIIGYVYMWVWHSKV